MRLAGRMAHSQIQEVSCHTDPNHSVVELVADHAKDIAQAPSSFVEMVVEDLPRICQQTVSALFFL
jgi:hypothetical protein